jgi:hypothetical protein
LIVLSGREALCDLYLQDSLGQLDAKPELGYFAVSNGYQVVMIEFAICSGGATSRLFSLRVSTARV